MAGRVFQLKATIVGTKPPVWRRVLVPESASLLDLHQMLQVAFGWHDCHLHEFEIDGVRYGTDDGGGGDHPPRASVVPAWGQSPVRVRRSGTSMTSATTESTEWWSRRWSEPIQM